MNYIGKHIETMSLLLRSSARYAYKRIPSDQHKKAYKLAMDACLSHIGAGWESIDTLRKKIEGVREDLDHHYKNGFFYKNQDNRNYYLMACDHADQVINSIELRFVTGGHDSEPRNYRNKGVYIYEDEGVF